MSRPFSSWRHSALAHRETMLHRCHVPPRHRSPRDEAQTRAQTVRDAIAREEAFDRRVSPDLLDALAYWEAESLRAG